MDSRLELCPACDELRDFVQPPCADGHTDDGGECPEWACADCGTALVIGGTVAGANRPRVRMAA
jgi:hypothetical protein